MVNFKRKKRKNIERKDKIDNFMDTVLNDKILNEDESIELKTKSDDKSDDLEVKTDKVEPEVILEKENEINFGGGDINLPPQPDEKETVIEENTEKEEEIEYKEVSELTVREYRFYMNTGKLPLKK